MDPSAMDFVMHQHDPSASTLDQHAAAHRSPCPAIRAAAAAQHNQLPAMLSHPRSGPPQPYDPVHGGSYNWWAPPYANQPHGWHQQPPPMNNFVRPAPPPLNSDPFQSPPAATSQSSHQSQPAQPGAMSPPENYSPSSPLPFGYRPPIPNLQRMGGPAGPLHGNLHGYGPGSGSNGGHSARPNGSVIPPLHQVPPPITGHQASHLSVSPEFAPEYPPPHIGIPSNLSSPPSRFSVPQAQTQNPNIPPTSPTRQEPHAHPQPNQMRPSESPQSGVRPRFSPIASGDARNQFYVDLTTSSVSRTMPPMPLSPGDQSTHLSGSVPVRMRHSARPSATISEPSSDEDPDLHDSDTSTRLFLEAVSTGGPVAFQGSEERIRAQQLFRGALSGRRVASRNALASLQSVKVEDLPEGEKTCVICYNDFGVENPEGINEAPLRLPKCKHVFGDHCIKKWFEESDSCPYCRDKVPSEPQYRQQQPHSSQTVLNFLRQHHVQMAAASSLRHRGNHGSNPSSPSRPSSGNYTTISALPFGIAPEVYGGPAESAFNRRPEAVPGSYRAWQYPLERRSPPNEFNDNRRRTRARHSSLRGSPPSARPNSYAPGHSQPQTPVRPRSPLDFMAEGHAERPETRSYSRRPPAHAYHHQYPPGGFNRFSPTHSHRHSASASANSDNRHSGGNLYEPSVGAPLVASPPFQAPQGGPETFPNPLQSGPQNLQPDSFRSGLREVRPGYAPPVSATIPGPDVHMMDSDQTRSHHRHHPSM